VTRTGCLTAASTAVLHAQLVDLPEKLFDPRTDLFTLGVQQPVVLGEPRDLSLRVGGFSKRGIFFSPQMRDHIDGALDTAFEAAKGVGFLFDGGHSSDGLLYFTAEAQGRGEESFASPRLRDHS